MIGSAKGSLGRPQKRTHETVRYPAPIGGIDIRQAVGSQDLDHCVYTYNLCPFEYGLRVREGYREWQIGVDAGASAGIHTLIPYDAANELGAGDKLFAINNEGIWDVTVVDQAPIQMVVFPNQDPDAGYGTFTHYVNQAEDDVLFYADNINGLYEYDSLTDSWRNTGIISGDITEADVKFVMSYKKSVWFAVRNSTVGYYLPIFSNSGQVTAQHFGDKFKHGGTLEGLFSWTVDGGDGVDDILVAVGHGGDVVVFTGDGPEADNWGMRGIYYIGVIPNTPRFGTEQGGILYLLSAYGLTSVDDLLRGVDTSVLQADIRGTSIAYKIAGLIRESMKLKRALRGWDVALIPSEGGILVSVPTLEGEAPIQYYYNLGTQGWGIWRDVPMQSFTEFQDTVYFGTADGRVMRMDVPVDNVLLTPVEGEQNGNDINFSILTAYSGLKTDGVYKRVKLIRPDFLSSLPPAHSSQARYDYELGEGLNFQLQPPIQHGLAEWDVGSWDNVVWGSNRGQTFPSIGGGWGYGRYIAVATKGTCRTTTRLVGWDVIFDIGGPLI
jgi:hypothetical protein